MEGSTRKEIMERDPVCGMPVDPAKAKATVDHAGKTYYFCCPSCAAKFKSDPQKYLTPTPADAHNTPHTSTHASSLINLALAPAPQRADSPANTYTCPMHPEIIRDAPGSCPICGMALEPRFASASDEENPELASMTRRFWWSIALTIPVLALAMSDRIPGVPLQRLQGGTQIDVCLGIIGL